MTTQHEVKERIAEMPTEKGYFIKPLFGDDYQPLEERIPGLHEELRDHEYAVGYCEGLIETVDDCIEELRDNRKQMAQLQEENGRLRSRLIRSVHFLCPCKPQKTACTSTCPHFNAMMSGVCRWCADVWTKELADKEKTDQ